MGFYTFVQNNTGGSFKGFRNLIIQAFSADEANMIATEYGVYFNGCATGEDCLCCGDRWYPVTELDRDDVPSYCGEPIEESDPDFMIVRA